MRIILLLLLAGLMSGCRSTQLYRLSEVPSGKDPFYRQHVDCGGFAILASEKVSPFALLEAAYLIDNMLANRPDIRQALVDSKIHMAVMAESEFVTDVPEYAYMRPKPYWDRRARGLGPIDRHPVVSVGAENLLQYEGDPYAEESILVHEFAHAIHEALKSIDPTFDAQLEALYDEAMAKGLWKDKYAGSNAAEYWAEGVQSYFGNNRPPDHDHNHVDTREELVQYDAKLAALIDTVFRGSTWQFVWPSERASLGHLRGYDRDKAPAFVWPDRLSGKWWEDVLGGYLEPLPGDLTGLHSKQDEGPLIEIFLLNQSKSPRDVYWVDYDGKPIFYERVRPGESFTCGSYLGHPFLVTDTDKKPLQVFYPHPEKLIGIIR
jgi:hypothetical protein